MGEVRSRLRHAIELDKAFRKLALDEEDLSHCGIGSRRWKRLSEPIDTLKWQYRRVLIACPAMRKLLDYKIVCGSHVEEVEKSIRDYIGDGWELLGPGYCCQDRHCQTIVKYEVSESGTPSAEIPSAHQVREVRRGF